MPVYSAGDIIGKTLYAAKRLPIYTTNFNTPVAYVEAGQPIGQVYSFVGGQDGKSLYWQFLGTKLPVYYVKHDSGNFEFDRTQRELIIDNVLSQEEKEKKAKEEAEKKDKGLFIYYFEKYATVALITVVGIVVFKEYMNKQK